MLKTFKKTSIFSIAFIIFIFLFSSSANGAERSMRAVDVFDELARQSGNQKAYARLITDNNEAWYARWHMISGAQRTIDVTYFIIKDDVFGKSMLGLLLRKAREGVKIRLMMDARGSGELTKIFAGIDYLQELLETPGVEIKVYNPISVSLRRIFGDIRNIVLSNHDKIILIDGELAMTGGRNISEIYFADPRDCEKVYRDADVFMKGKAVAGRMKQAFDEEFDSHQAFKVKRELFGNIVPRAEELEIARRAMLAHMVSYSGPSTITLCPL
jgi:phosphatidylserine/phosphatidylglycerophosphate/cardiolipin synthase-like enzyme